jgi:membrane-associated phospholipid phosphatase
MADGPGYRSTLAAGSNRDPGSSVVEVTTEVRASGSAPPVATVPGASGRRRESRRELTAGAVLLGLVALEGLYLALRPGTGLVDRWFLDLIPGSGGSWFTDVTWLRFPVVVVIGAVLAAAVTVPRDRARALACLVGPPGALLAAELVVKPLVGRTLGGALSYPSGTTVGAAALATAAVLATPARGRVVAVVVATVFSLWMAVAVVALRWHLPTDALAGLLFGVGTVLVVDGLAFQGLDRFHRRGRPTRAGPVSP